MILQVLFQNRFIHSREEMIMAKTPAKVPAKKPAAKAAAAPAKPAAKSTAKPAGQSAARKTATPKPPATRAPRSRTLSAPPPAVTVSDEQRYRMVAEAAYYRAESSQFKSDPVRDWIEAEKDIAILLASRK